MEDPSTAPARWTSADWLLVGLLVFMAAGIRVWQLAHTEVAARDSIGFIRISWQLHQHPLSEWPTVIRHAEQHPVYPLTILPASVPLRALDLTEAGHMRLRAQLPGALPAILAALPRL